jgi:hypothetical protein
MALLYKAQLVPSKLELVAGWAPQQRWFAGQADADLANIASFRFDDPAGEVGVETLLVRAGDGPVLQVPLTYRNDEVPGAEHFLIGTLEHSVLGTRWVYDAAGDPVYLAELARAVLTGGTQVEQHYEIDGKQVPKDPTAIVNGSGAPGTAVPSAQDDHVPAARNDLSSTLVETDHLSFLIARKPVEHPLALDDRWESLDGTWTGQDEPVTLALAAARG